MCSAITAGADSGPPIGRREPLLWRSKMTKPVLLALVAQNACCGPACCLAPGWPSARQRSAARRRPVRPGPTTVSLGLNRSLVTPRQQAAAVRRRADRAARRPPGADRDRRRTCEPRLVLADQFRAHLADAVVRAPAPGDPLLGRLAGAGRGRRDRAEDVQRRSTVPSSPAFFPEWPTVEKIDETSFTLNTDASGAGARLPDVQHPHHPRGGERARGSAVRCRAPGRTW